MKIILKNEWCGHKAGREMEVNDITGLTLIERGVAKAFVGEPPSGHVTCTRCGAFVKIENKKPEPELKPELIEPKSVESEVAEPATPVSSQLDAMIEGK